MPFRRIWTEEDDRVLKYLRQDLNIHKWSLISQKLEHDFGIIGRNQKQCRQRQNIEQHSSLKLGKLTEHQEKLLLNLHNRFGNKWAEIAKYFQGRTDASLKNLFHSKLRKAIRKLNRLTKEKCNGAFRFYPLNLVRKIMDQSEPNLIVQSIESSQRSELLRELQNGLLEYSGSAVDSPMFIDWNQRKISEHLRNLLDKILEFQYQDFCSETDQMSDQSQYVPLKITKNPNGKKDKSKICSQKKVALQSQTKERASDQKDPGYSHAGTQQGRTVKNLVIFPMESSIEAQSTQSQLLQSEHKQHSFDTDGAEAQEVSNNDNFKEMLKDIDLLLEQKLSHRTDEQDEILDWDTILIRTHLDEELFEKIIEVNLPDPILF